MNSIYFSLFLLALCCFSTARGSGGMIPRRSNEVFYREQQQQHQQKLGVAKYADRKYPSTAWNSSRRLIGRHVCAQSKVVMVPVKDMQSYCKPMYQSYLRRCDKDGSGYCTGFRVVYELAYRAVQMLMPKTESVYTCCPGWTQTHVSAADCKKAICREPCRNGGMCTKPDYCACVPGWTGKTCETDVDECARRRHGCEQDCVNTPGSYMCLCKDGFILQADRRSCKKNEIQKNSEDTTELIKKIESLQQRLVALENWQRKTAMDIPDSRHPRDDRINSLSEQIAIIEETLEECSCFTKSDLSLPRPKK